MYNVYIKCFRSKEKKRCICIKRRPFKMPQLFFTFTLATGHKMGVTKLR